ncbi:DUF3054 domain-containing protein [Actinomycetospora soli]|uniref:DUF3054 domain-containing protein n=1 Tax=Actinomycetospora soli TaxID=2893887 RepID=UPI001E2DDC8A|nr:DUF3054 domain-containing protein [Actinomycetospora soli]MCD2189550.1 DUF3054 domain-containing protein [Actinomycetospora soli]
MRTRALALIDLLAVLVFAAIGRRSHDESGALLGVVTTAAPFLLGAVVGALVARSWRDPLSWRSGIAVWLGAVVVGLTLRAILFDRLPLSFALVATISLAVLVLGWRAVVRAVTAVRGRRHHQEA